MKLLALLCVFSVLRGIGVNGNEHPLFNDPDEQYRYESKMEIPHRREAYEQWREFGFYDEAVVKGRFPELDAVTSSVLEQFNGLEMSQARHKRILDFAQQAAEAAKRRSPPYDQYPEAELSVAVKGLEERVNQASKELQDFEDQQKAYMEDVWETYKVISYVRGNARDPDVAYYFLSVLDEEPVVGEDSAAESLRSDSETLTQNPSDLSEEPPAGQFEEIDSTKKLKSMGFGVLGGLGVAGLVGLIYVVVSKLKPFFKPGNKAEEEDNDRRGIIPRSTLESGGQEVAMRIRSRLHSRQWY
jgi:hypothetical protein